MKSARVARGYDSTRPIFLRLAKSSDANELSSLLVELVGSPARGRTREVRKTIREREILVATIADSGHGKIIGFIHATVHNDPISAGPLLYITSFYVKPHFRGKGIGTRMLTSMIERAAKNFRIRGIEVATARRRALRLYKRLGFTQFRADFGEKLLGLDLRKWKEDLRVSAHYR